MPRLAHPLSARRVAVASIGRHYDGGGLQLWVRSLDRAFWVYRYVFQGRTREAGLGRARGRDAVPLAEARARAAKMRLMLHEGLDPLAERDTVKAEARAGVAKDRVAATPFARVADHYLAAHESSWKNLKHAQQWHNTLRDYVLPAIGRLPVTTVTTAEVMAILEPIWREKSETASRVRGRIESILDFARARGWRDGENPARWKGHLDHLLPARAKVARVEHHKAVDWRDIGACMAKLCEGGSASARCLEFAVLTAARSSEARGARWSEIDLGGGTWTIPAERMKAGRAHRVPLSGAACAVLERMTECRDGALVFPGGRAGSPLSDVALNKALAATGFAATVHGFRSTFRDWASEATAHPPHAVELALAHTIGDKVEAAYRRGDLFEKRRRLMDDWAEFCAQPAAQVVPLRPVVDAADDVAVA